MNAVYGITHLSVDELDIMGTLRVAVTSTVLGTSFVGGELGNTTVGVHLDQVNCTVESTRKLGHVNVERELLVLQLEHLVFGI